MQDISESAVKNVRLCEPAVKCKIINGWNKATIAVPAAKKLQNGM